MALGFGSAMCEILCSPADPGLAGARAQPTAEPGAEAAQPVPVELGTFLPVA